MEHQDQRAGYCKQKPAESPPPGGRNRGDWFAHRIARGFNSRIHEHRIEGFKGVVGPGRNDDLRIRLSWYSEFLESAKQQKRRWPVLSQRGRVADPNKELGAKPRFTHAPRASSTTHRISDEDVHHSKCPLGLQEIEPAVGEGAELRRFSISRLIHGIAIKTSGGERLTETKSISFEAPPP